MKADIGQATVTVRRYNKDDGSVDYYSVKMTGEGGDEILGRVTPAALEEAFDAVLGEMLKARVEALRTEFNEAVDDVKSVIADAKTSFNERSRLWPGKLGLAQVRKPKIEEEPPAQ